MRAKERGSTAIVVAIMLAVLCGFVAMSLDIGHIFSVRGELQNGADAAALAGARRLNGTNTNFELEGAIADARNYARNHPTDLFDVEPTTIQLGAWVPAGQDCPPSSVGVATSAYGYKLCEITGRTEAAAADINAVRVITSRAGAADAAGGGAVPLAFGAFVGHAEPAPVGAEAIALTGGPRAQSCPELPITIRAGCLYDGGGLRCDANGTGAIYFIGLNPAPIDSAGLTSLSDDPANPGAFCDILTRTDCTEIDEGTPINIQNGTSWNASCDQGCSSRSYTDGAAPRSNNTICEVIRKRADDNCDGTVDVGPDGRPAFRSQVPVVQYAGEAEDTCSGNYNQSATIVGWATISIVSVRCERESQVPFDTFPITRICDDFMRARGEFSAGTCVAVQFHCNEEDDEQSQGGGGWFGTAPPQPSLVR